MIQLIICTISILPQSLSTNSNIHYYVGDFILFLMLISNNPSFHYSHQLFLTNVTIIMLIPNTSITTLSSQSSLSPI